MNPSTNLDNDNNSLNSHLVNKEHIKAKIDQDSRTLFSDMDSIDEFDKELEDINEEASLQNMQEGIEININKTTSIIDINEINTNDYCNQNENIIYKTQTENLHCQCRSCKFQQATKKPSKSMYYCHIHDKKFRNKLIFKEHLKKRHYFFCNYCGNEVFIDKTKISLFVERLYSFKCLECQNNYYCTKEAFNYNPNVTTIDNKYKCPSCQKTFATEKSLRKHITKKHPESIRNTKKVLLIKEQTYQQLEHNCIVEEKDLSIIISNQLIKDNLSEAKEPIKALDIETELDSDITETSCVKHKDIQSKLSIINEVDDSINLLQCEKCNKVFKSQIDKSNHLKSHENECLECKKLFEYKADYERHCLNQHSHICNECNKRFKTIKGLSNHCKLKHETFAEDKSNENNFVFDINSTDCCNKQMVESQLQKKKN